MLEVHYNTMKNYDEHSFTANDKSQADALGWFLMATGIAEITKKTIPELLFRVRFMDYCWGKDYFVGSPSDDKLIELFLKHVGLKIVITNRGIKNISIRHKFMVSQIKNIEERIERQINK